MKAIDALLEESKAGSDDEEKEDKETKAKDEEIAKLKAEKAKMAELLKAETEKKESFFKKARNLFVADKEEEEEEEEPETKEEEEEAPKKSKKKSKLEKQNEEILGYIAHQRMRDMMDELGIPKDKKVRGIFTALLAQKEDEVEELSDKDIEAVAKETLQIAKLSKKTSKKAGKDDEELDEKDKKILKLKKQLEDDEEEEEDDDEEEEDAVDERDLEIARLEKELKKKGKVPTGKRMKGSKRSVDIVSDKDQANLKAFKDMGPGKRQILAKNNPKLYKKLQEAEIQDSGYETIDLSEAYL